MKVGDLKVVLKLTIDKFKAGLMKAKTQLRTFKTGMIKAAQGMKNAFMSLIPSIKRLGLVLGATFTGAAIAAARFEEEMHRTGVVLGNGARIGEQAFSAITEKARELGRETLFTSTQAAKGMKILAKAGFQTEEVLSSIGDVINLAIAQETDLETSTKVLAATMRQFGLDASQAGKISDVLSTAANSAMITVEGLGDALKFSGTVAKGFGNSLEDAVAVTAAMANLGLDASQTGTTLRRLLTRLINPSTGAAAAMKKLNINIDDGTGKMKPMIQILAELQNEYQTTSLSTLEFQQALSEAAGQRGITGLLGLVSQTGLSLENLARKMDRSTGSAKKMADEFRKTTVGRFKDFIASLNELSITLVQGFGNSIKDSIFGLRNWILELEKALRKGDKFKIIIDGIKAGLKPLADLLRDTANAFLEWVKTADPKDIAQKFKEFFTEISETIMHLSQAIVNIPWKDMATALGHVLTLLTKVTNALAKMISMTTKLTKGKGIFGVAETAGGIIPGGVGGKEAGGGAAGFGASIARFAKDLFTKQKQAQEEIKQVADKQQEALESMKDTVVEGQAESVNKIQEAGTVVSHSIKESGQVLGNTLSNVGQNTSQALGDVENEVRRNGQLNMAAINQLANSVSNLNSKMNQVVTRLQNTAQKGSK